jgi:HSP20 family protein
MVMKTPTYPIQDYSSFARKSLTSLFFDRMLYNYNASLSSATMREHEDGFVLNVLVPGLNKKDLNLQIDGSTLTISSNVSVHSKKMLSSGLCDFSYSFPLPLNADADRITAKCRDGLLTVQIPKLKTKSTRATIPVTGSENATLKTNPFKTTWSQIKKTFNFSEWVRFKNPLSARALGSSAG